MHGVLLFHLCFYFVSMNLHGWNLLYMDGWISVLDEQCETFVICKDAWNYICVGYVCIYDETCVLDMLVVYICISVNCCQIK